MESGWRDITSQQFHEKDGKFRVEGELIVAPKEVQLLKPVPMAVVRVGLPFIMLIPLHFPNGNRLSAI